MATDDPIRSYLDAKRSFEEVHAKCEGYRDFFRELSTAFGRFWDVGFSNLGVSYPIDGPTRHIDGNRWPDATAIAQDLSDWHSRFNDLRNAWRRVPEADRSGLQAPPDFR